MASEDAGHGTSTLPLQKKEGIKSFSTILLLFAVVLPAFVSLGILYRQSLPAPYQDDYAVFLDFASDYVQSPGARTKVLDIATSQVNEYRLVFAHAIAASELQLTHHLNFALLTALGNLFLPATGFLLWLTHQDEDRDLAHRLLAFLPISLLFFSLTYWENLNWATTDLQNIPIVFFSLLAIYFLCGSVSPETSNLLRLIGACAAAMVAAFTSANGFLLGPVGAVFLLTRRAYTKALVWCASFALPLAAYLYHYASVPHAVLKARMLNRPLFFLAFLGCGAIPFRWPAAAVGAGMLVVFWIAARSRFDRERPAAFYFAVWVLGTAGLVAWVRGLVGFYVVSRYSIYSLLMLIFSYYFLAQHLPRHFPTFHRRRFYVTSTVFAMCIFVLADLHAYSKLGARRRMVLTGIEHYRADPVANSPMIDQHLLKGSPEERESEQRAMTRAIQTHVYALPKPQQIQ
jgi:hypothetical protein